MQTQIAKGLISIEMDNILPAEVKKLRNYFTLLVEAQIHRMRNGKVILHFDSEGNLMKIEVQRTTWKRVKSVDKS